MSSDKKNVIMIADDDAFVRLLVKTWLGAEASVVEVDNGADVLDTYARIRPDIVFLDIHLPIKNGKKIVRELRQAYPEAYVVMISADSNKVNIFSSMYAGAKAFVSKPFTRDTLRRYYLSCPGVPKDMPSPILELEMPKMAEKQARG